jgi:hypothetical protein
MAVGAVGNGPPFSKARWARLRVHGAGSVHGLFWRDDRRRDCVGVAKPVEPQAVCRDDRRSWGILCGRFCHEAASARLVEAFPRRLACSVRKLGTSNSNSTE